MNSDPSKVYKSPKGRQYKVIGIGKIPNTSKWVGKVLKSHWYTYIRFLDNEDISKVLHDHNGKIYKIEKI